MAGSGGGSRQNDGARMQRSKLDRVMYAVMDSQKVRRLVTLADGTTQR